MGADRETTHTSSTHTAGWRTRLRRSRFKCTPPVATHTDGTAETGVVHTPESRSHTWVESHSTQQCAQDPEAEAGTGTAQTELRELTQGSSRGAATTSESRGPVCTESTPGHLFTPEDGAHTTKQFTSTTAVCHTPMTTRFTGQSPRVM